MAKRRPFTREEARLSEALNRPKPGQGVETVAGKVPRPGLFLPDPAQSLSPETARVLGELLRIAPNLRSWITRVSQGPGPVSQGLPVMFGGRAPQYGPAYNPGTGWYDSLQAEADSSTGEIWMQPSPWMWGSPRDRFDTLVHEAGHLQGVQHPDVTQELRALLGFPSDRADTNTALLEELARQAFESRRRPPKR